MAEVLGLVASVASLIALISETSKACNKLAKNIKIFINAPADVQKISAELLDLAQVLELFQSILQPIHGGRAGENAHVDFIERSLARVRTDVQEISDLLVSVQSKARSRNAKGRVKWVIMKNDITSMMGIVDRQKQNLLMQVNVLNLKITQMGYANLEASRSDTKQVETRVENMTEMFRASNSQTASRIESRIQSSTASLGTSIKDEIHRAMSSIPRETNISRASLETLSTLVAQTVASQFESLASEDSLERLSRHSCFGRESNQRMANNTSQTETVEYITAETQVTVDECSEEQPGDLHREVASSRLTSRTSVQKMTTFLGTMLIRRSTINSTFSSSSPELITERTKAEIDFLPAHWLWSWTGCGMFLARMGLGKPRFDFSFDVARVLDFKSDPEAIRTLSAVRSGDLDALKRYFQSKTAYPTDRDESGTSLLAVAADCGQLDTCKLLLQQGAGVDINTPSSWGNYPLHDAIPTRNIKHSHDMVRLFLNYDADVTMRDAEGRTGGVLALQCFPSKNNKTHRSETLFRFLAESESSFDIHQRDEIGRTLLMQAFGQNLQVYKYLLRLGANARDLDADGSTVLHYFFKNVMYYTWNLFVLNDFLDHVGILALLIQAGADAKAKNRFGKRPYEHPSGEKGLFNPLIPMQERVNLAFWHHALRVCGLCQFEFCGCGTHRQNMMPLRDSCYLCQSCAGPLDRFTKFDAFEEELSAAFKSWDKSSAEEYYQANYKAPYPSCEPWRRYCDDWDEKFQGILKELDARSKRRVCRCVPTHPVQPTENLSRNTKEASSEKRNEIVTSNGLTELGPTSSPQQIASDDDWRTGSDSSSDDDWESAPET